jgi:peptide/nickel transport system permease protein
VLLVGEVRHVEGERIVLVDTNGKYYILMVDRNTDFQFPAGEGLPRPEDGSWLNISWLTGFDGILSNLSQFHGPNQGIFRLDFGTSWRLSPSQPVSELLMSRLGNTMRLMITATVLSLIIAIPIGIYSGVHQYSKADYAVTTFAFFGSAMPVFWFGLMLILIFAVGFKDWGLPYMPSGGVALVRTAPPGSLEAIMDITPGSTVDQIIHIILPASMLSLAYMAGWSRFMRSSMLEVLRQDYVRTARAKGLLQRAVIYKHALRNALIPIITIVVFQIPGFFGGATLTETVFSYPGIGRLYFEALGANDWPIVMAILFITAILVVFATLLGDFLYTVVDPRIRFS